MPEERRLGEVPGPRGHWFWGSIQERRREPLQLFTRAHQEHGDFVRLRMGPTIHLLSLASPELIKHVLVDHADRYNKPPSFLRDVRDLLGNGLFSSEGDFWKRQRRLMQPSFHKERLATLAEGMVDVTGQMLARWRSHSTSAPLDIFSEMMRLTLAVVGRALFSTDVSGTAERVGQAMAVALEEVNYRGLSFGLRPPDFIPTARNRAWRRVLSTLDAIVFDIIARRREGQTHGDDLLATLMATQDADTGERMTDQQLRDETMTLFLAGHETTATALAWMWHLLSQHPDVEARARAEVDTVLGDRLPTADDLPHLRYLTQIFEETLRLYPPAWLFARQPVKEDVLAGVHIPASPRVIVTLNAYVLQRNPKLWPDPERFDPDRFSPEHAADRPRFSLLPFGGGQRLCIGNAFALMEATLITATVLQRFQLRALPGRPVEPEPLITLRPKGGLPMLLEPLSRPARVTLPA
ncbi:cytochrome P450 [Archangium lipolyticum]|uniref:cytochrome P450 n=1 Tax=Archangium lipolyticum TaxID=2970465 RepID=UPI002149FF1E|nr:cytochrome P450 [Archangium lipolyticum]